MTDLKIGDKAPEFLVEIAKNKQVSLSDFQGKYVVLYFYPKDDTPGCTLEAMDFNELLPEFTKLNTVILGISTDSLKSHDNFKTRYNLKFDLGADTSNNTCNNYGVWVSKSMFGKKYMGVNRATYLINPEGFIAHIWPKVSVAGHIQEVIEKIRSIS